MGVVLVLFLLAWVANGWLAERMWDQHKAAGEAEGWKYNREHYIGELPANENNFFMALPFNVYAPHATVPFSALFWDELPEPEPIDFSDPPQGMMPGMMPPPPDFQSGMMQPGMPVEMMPGMMPASTGMMGMADKAMPAPVSRREVDALLDRAPFIERAVQSEVFLNWGFIAQTLRADIRKGDRIEYFGEKPETGLTDEELLDQYFGQFDKMFGALSRAAKRPEHHLPLYYRGLDTPLSHIMAMKRMNWLLKYSALAKLDDITARLKQLKLEAGTQAEEDARAAKKNDNDVNKAMVDAMNKFNNRFKTVNQYKAELLAYQSVADENKEAFKKQIGKAGRIARERKAQLHLKIGDKKEAENLASQSTKAVGQVQPLANYADILWQSGKEKEAIEQFKKLREISAHLDIDKAVFQRLAPIAKKLELPDDWRIEYKPSDDVGDRPALDTLGPLRWAPSPATQWALTDGQGKKHSLADYAGKPVIVIFYLGKGCAHCIEQLSAFAPEVDRFKQAGIDLVAISTDHIGGLLETFQLNQNKPFPFPLLSDASLEVFKQYRAYDDFEKQPLHGTFLIDRAGLVRWQDISYEPFEEVEFLLNESKRLLAQDPPQVTKR